jgi:hypothetical protein
VTAPDVLIPVAVPLAMIFAVLGVAKVLAVPRMRAAAAHAGLGVAAYRVIGVLELAAAAGIVAGLRFPALGLLTAVGVVGLMIGALRVHLRNRDAALRWVPAMGTTVLAIAYGALVSGAVA